MVLKEMQDDHVPLVVALYSEPMVETRISNEPVLVVAPVRAVGGMIELF